MKPISCNQEIGDTERLCAQEPHRVLLNISSSGRFNKGPVFFQRLPWCGSAFYSQRIAIFSFAFIKCSRFHLFMA